MPNWRYLIDAFPGRLPELNKSTLEEFLNMRGNQGWELIHFGRVSSRQNVSFAAPNLMIGYVRYLRKSGVPRLPLFTYKLVFTLDAPVQLFGKSAQYLWRRLTGSDADKVDKSREALRGGWQFLTRELRRFWRT